MPEKRLRGSACGHPQTRQPKRERCKPRRFATIPREKRRPPPTCLSSCRRLPSRLNSFQKFKTTYRVDEGSVSLEKVEQGDSAAADTVGHLGHLEPRPDDRGQERKSSYNMYDVIPQQLGLNGQTGRGVWP